MYMSMRAGRPSLPINSTITRGGGGRKMDFQAKNPMQPERLASAPRCLARTRSRTACQSPAVKGRKRCRMHGGTNPGAPKGNRNS
ncbi:HGGxSTG domain-containing protein [Sphingomonas sp.]|uniref:HGGxSTG domain-containing protein n=1 Tax=Sphingomonas sp. TaxID=28214 RepID=UPI0035A86FCD